MRDRLVYWAEVNGKLNEAQFGFREGRRTTDPIFILSTAMQADKKKRKPLYACFVDFAKAFDGLPPEIFKGFNSQLISFTTALFNKLLEQETCQLTYSVDSIFSDNLQTKKAHTVTKKKLNYKLWGSQQRLNEQEQNGMCQRNMQ